MRGQGPALRPLRAGRPLPVGVPGRALGQAGQAEEAGQGGGWARGGPRRHAGAAAPGQVSESDEKTWGIISNISIPFFGFIGPLIVYLVYKDRSPWLKDTSTEGLNFSILYTVASVVCSILIPLLIGAILLPIVFIAALIFCILAAVAANRHDLYRYPVNWRLIN